MGEVGCQRKIRRSNNGNAALVRIAQAAARADKSDAMDAIGRGRILDSCGIQTGPQLCGQSQERAKDRHNRSGVHYHQNRHRVGK
jgi:hypothetical protein